MGEVVRPEFYPLGQAVRDRLAAALDFDRELSNPNAGESAKKLCRMIEENM